LLDGNAPYGREERSYLTKPQIYDLTAYFSRIIFVAGGEIEGRLKGDCGNKKPS